MVDLMTDSQLAAAADRFHSMQSIKSFIIPLTLLRQTWSNHWHRVMRMPAGGAQAGGSMQTGFEMEMITCSAAHELMAGWPNKQEIRGGGMSWEARSMEEAGALLDFAKAPASWGALNGKPIPPLPSTREHRGVLMASPPITVAWQQRADGSTCLTVRFPLTIWMEDNAMILPPDDAQGNCFYQDPPGRSGMHRDLFKVWAHKLVGELLMEDYSMSKLACQHLPAAYKSDSSFVESEDARSVSSWGDVDSSDLEGAHRPPDVDSSDLEGAHLE